MMRWGRRSRSRRKRRRGCRSAGGGGGKEEKRRGDDTIMSSFRLVFRGVQEQVVSKSLTTSASTL